MKFYPAQHQPARLAGLSAELTHRAAPTTLPARTALLFFLVAFSAGFFAGGIAIGTWLVRDTERQLATLRAETLNPQP